MHDIILTTGPLGGLGDHMVYTSLPERFSSLGHRVFLDQDCLTRNGDVYELLWSMNPYIIGTTDRKPNAGYVNQGKFYEEANKRPIGCIEAMERAHGLPPPYSLAPKIYYTPQPYHIPLGNGVLVDFNAVSSKIGQQGILDLIIKMQDRFPGCQFYALRFPSTIVEDQQPLRGADLHVENIFRYVDMLASCRAFVGSEAGGQALAAAVRGEHDVYDLDARPEIVALFSPKTFNSRGYTFRGVDCRVTVTGNISGDYWEPAEVPYGRYQVHCRTTVEEQRAKWEAGQPKAAATP